MKRHWCHGNISTTCRVCPGISGQNSWCAFVLTTHHPPDSARPGAPQEDTRLRCKCLILARSPHGKRSVQNVFQVKHVESPAYLSGQEGHRTRVLESMWTHQDGNRRKPNMTILGSIIWYQCRAAHDVGSACKCPAFEKAAVHDPTGAPDQ